MPPRGYYETKKTYDNLVAHPFVRADRCKHDGDLPLFGTKRRGIRQDQRKGFGDGGGDHGQGL